MTRILATLYFWLVASFCAFAQNAPEGQPTAYTEPASVTAVIVFLVLFVGSIALFAFWIWYRSRKHK